MKLIPLESAKEEGADLPSQFKFGEHVSVCLDDTQGKGKEWIAGWVCGINYTPGQVRYNVAIQLGNSSVCQVMENVRLFMRSTDDNTNQTNFIDIRQLDLNDPRLE